MTHLNTLTKLRVMKELHSLQNRTYELAALQLGGTIDTNKLMEASFADVDTIYSNIEQILRDNV